MAWALLIAAGLLEVAWASTLPATQGFTRVVPTLGFLALLVASMLALAKASQGIPIGTAYAVWVGIGIVGTAIVGIAVHDDPATPMRLVFLVLLILSIVGLKLTSTP